MQWHSATNLPPVAVQVGREFPVTSCHLVQFRGVTRLLALAVALTLGVGVPHGWAATCDIGVPACCGGDVDCDDLELCSGTETCEIATGTCQAGTAAGDGTGCNDSDLCTTSDTCQGGVCVGAFPVVCDDGNPCTDDVCDPGTGNCTSPSGTDGIPCEDMNACTQDDRCMNGACLGFDPVVCDDANDCTTDSCNPATGQCVNQQVLDGQACSDGDLCSQTDSCQGGVCTGANPVVCNDADPCTADACNPGTGGCLTPPGPDGDPCDDGDLCTQTDSCQSGLCVGTAPVACNDLDVCTDDACNPATGSCQFTPTTDGTPCTDGDTCTLTDTCSAGVCVGTAPVTCNDLRACTEDRCENGTCVFTPRDVNCPGAECFDGACRPADPDADGAGCVAVPARETEPCTDDGVPCTSDQCASGSCVHVPIHARCEVTDTCAQATCEPTSTEADADGCRLSPAQSDGSTCTEDLDPCTRDICRTGMCAHEPVPSLQACAPVADPFRQSLVLAAFAVELSNEVDATPQLGDGDRLALRDLLEQIRAGLVQAAGQLNGLDPTADTAQARSRQAFPLLKPLTKQARRFVKLVKQAQRRGELAPEDAVVLKENGRDLLRGVRTLKRDVRRLRKVTRVFSR